MPWKDNRNKKFKWKFYNHDDDQNSEKIKIHWHYLLLKITNKTLNFTVYKVGKMIEWNFMIFRLWSSLIGAVATFGYLSTTNLHILNRMHFIWILLFHGKSCILSLLLCQALRLWWFIQVTLHFTLCNQT